MKKNIHKYYNIFLCSVIGCFTSCYIDNNIEVSDMEKDTGKTRSVKFEIKTIGDSSPALKEAGENLQTTANNNEDLLLDAFIVKKTDSSYTLLANDNDTWSGSDKNGYVLSKNLEVGQYHFSMIKGGKRVSSENEGNNGKYCYIVTSETESNSISDFNIIHPYSGGLLKDCNKLYLENNNGNFSTMIDLTDNSDGTDKHNFSTSLTHAQARVDVIVIKAQKENDGSYSIIDEDPFNNNKISDIKISLEGLNNACKLENISFFRKENIPTSYIKTITSTEFENFDYNTYKQDFKAEDPLGNITNLQPLTENDYNNIKIFRKGIYLFPTTTENNSLNLTLSVNFRQDSGLEPTEVTTNIKEGLTRNNVRLIVVWLLNEKFNLQPDIDVSNELPEYKDGVAAGDEGFWN